MPPIYLPAQGTPKFWSPDYFIPTIAHFDPQVLKQGGIEAVAFDVDNTLTSHKGTAIDDDIKAGLERFESVFPPYKIAIISNTKSEERKGQLKEMFPNYYISKSEHKKPHPEPFIDVERQMKYHPNQMALFDDLIFTGIAGGNARGWTTI